MVNQIDKMLGVIERTSAEIAEGFYYPGMKTTWGYFWSINHEGKPWAAFEQAPGEIVVGFSSDDLIAASKVAAGINIIVQVSIKGDDGAPVPFVIVGPRGRVKKIFRHLGKDL